MQRVIHAIAPLSAAQRQEPGIAGGWLVKDVLALIRTRIGIINDTAAKRMAEIQANLARTYFAWSGPTTQWERGLLAYPGADSGD